MLPDNMCWKETAAVFVSTSSFPIQVCCVLTLGLQLCLYLLLHFLFRYGVCSLRTASMQRGKGLKAIAFEWDKASLVVNELFCIFGKEGDLIRHVIIQVFFFL